MVRVAISIGDINGIGPEIALRAHDFITNICEPIYFAHHEILLNAADMLKINMPKNMICSRSDPNSKITLISPGEISKDSGLYSFNSFKVACQSVLGGECDFVATLPIHKLAWAKAGINYVGHTEALNSMFNTKSIMLLGAPNDIIGEGENALFVALFTHHIALKDVSKHIIYEDFLEFLLTLWNNTNQFNFGEIAVLGLNPHAGDGGLLGNEEQVIKEAIERANDTLKGSIFKGPFPPDTAFSPHMRKKYKLFVAPYHDLGLAPLKALYFYDAINVTLNIPIIRTSVDHGVGFDIAYQNKANLLSYKNAISFGLKWLQMRNQN
ncbi:MAG: 4-hydroxythreonine-4-phosphate dehydrogenase [Helicobacter sp.]|nr:4-hydroxythreonine-4-phosphate dehydrogenase [Helicobacter sp.]